MGFTKQEEELLKEMIKKFVKVKEKDRLNQIKADIKKQRYMDKRLTKHD